MGTVGSDVTSFTWNNLREGVAYTFRVKAKGGSGYGDSGYSNVESFTFSTGARMIDGSEEVQEQIFSIYPNPTTSYLTITGDDIQRIKLTDLNGRELRVDVIERSGAYQIDMTQMKQGIYLVEITTEKTTKIQKVVKK